MGLIKYTHHNLDLDFSLGGKFYLRRLLLCTSMLKRNIKKVMNNKCLKFMNDYFKI